MELLTTLLGGSILGFVTTLLGQFAKSKAKQQEMMLQAMNQRAKIVNQARQHGMKDKGFAWTRRVIALTCVITIVCVPFAAPFLGIPILVSEEVQGGFSIPFIWESTKEVVWTEVEGIPLAPMYLHTLAAIVSFYFGSSAAR
tara:strand:+ start:8893 stop:9318 length:426 start_codon:yes stop_codon:yes gene_type:complete